MGNAGFKWTDTLLPGAQKYQIKLQEGTRVNKIFSTRRK